MAYDYSKRTAVQNEAGTAALKAAENKAKVMAGDVKSYSPGKIRIEARVNASFSLDCAAPAE